VVNFNPWRGIRFSTYACNAIIRGFVAVARRERRFRDRNLKAQELRSPETRDDDGSSFTHNGRDEVMAKRMIQEAPGLTASERFVLAHRYLTEKSTLEKVGRLIKVSKERARQIQLSGLSKIREALVEDCGFRRTVLVDL
jgi:RNA polymerase sigma factor (sigma-70 family)